MRINSNTTVKLSLDQLAGALSLRRKSANTYRGACVIHGGSSFEITEKNGMILLKCWHGCDNADIIKELQYRQLWHKVHQGVIPLPSRAVLEHAQMTVLLSLSDRLAGRKINAEARKVGRKAIAIVSRYGIDTPQGRLADAAAIALKEPLPRARARYLIACQQERVRHGKCLSVGEVIEASKVLGWLS